MYSFGVVGCSAAISISMCVSIVSNQLFFPCPRGIFVPPSGGSIFASATQNTQKGATYVPSIASGTTFIVFSTTTNSTMTIAILALSPIKNARIARCPSAADLPPKPSNAMTRLAAVLIPPPTAADKAACGPAISQLARAQTTVTAAWPSTTLRASRRARAKSIATKLNPVERSSTVRLYCAKNGRRIIERPPWCIKAFEGYFVALMDVGQDAFQLVQTVVADNKLALPRDGMLKGDFGAQLLGNFGFQAADVGVLRRGGGAGLGRFRIDDAAHQTFGIAHRQGFLGDQSRNFDLLAAGGEPQQGARVTACYLTGFSHFLDLVAQFHEPHS